MFMSLPSRIRHVAAAFASVVVFAALLALGPSQVLALGADYGPEQLKEAGSIGGQSPVSGYWTGLVDVFFYYAGDAEAFNRFIVAYSKFKHCRLEVLIHRGQTQAASLSHQLDIPADWSSETHYSGRKANVIGEEEVDLQPIGEPAPTRVDVWVGQRLHLEDLLIPPSLKVNAAGDSAQDAEIQAFISTREAPLTPAQTEVTTDRAGGPFRLTVELSDGSRLLGEASDVKDLALQATFGQVSVPLEQVASIEFPGDQSAAVVSFRNGDRLTGVLNPANWEALKLRTVVGEVTVPTRLIRRCAIAPAPRVAKVNVRASGVWQTETPDKAFDGHRDTDWNSGSYAPAWIEADLGVVAQLATIWLLPCQDIAGATTHEIWVSDEPIGDDLAKARLIHTFHGETTDRQPLSFEFAKGLTARYIQIRTTESPTWIAWWDVEIRVENKNDHPSSAR